MSTDYPVPNSAEFLVDGTEYRLRFHPCHLGEWERLYVKAPNANGKMRWARITPYEPRLGYIYDRMLEMLELGVTHYLGYRMTTLNGNPV